MKHWFDYVIGSMLVLCLGVSGAEANSEASPEANSGTGALQLRVLTYNIHHGEGVDGQFDYPRLANIIKRVNPDVVALQEVDRKTQRASGIDQAALLSQLTGMDSAYGKAMHYSGGEYGQAILSRFPITEVKSHPLPFTSTHEPRALLVTTLQPDNGLPELIFAGTHLCHQSEELRTDQARQINAQLPESGESPVILAGDLNARQGSTTMKELLNSRWIDATAEISRIDYILLRPIDPWRILATTTIDEPVASDHKPVLAVLEWTGPLRAHTRQTRVSIKKDQWYLNDTITYPGAPAEGLLMNLRAVNATFEDRHRPEFDPNENTDRFLKTLPDYMAHGVRALTLNLQGGMPGYEGAVNSAFNPDGTLSPKYLQRIERVIEACDLHGAAVILGCYYQRQDQILRDDAAVRQGVVNAAKWIQSRGFTNVLLEISNEFNHPGFDHAILKSTQGQVELITLAQHTVPGLPVSTSGLGDGKIPDAIAQAADFILIHYNGTKPDDIPIRIQALKRFGKPIVCNEDDKTGPAGARAAELSVEHDASWGYMNKEVNQYLPLQFNGCHDDFSVYDTLQELTSPDTMVFPGSQWQEATPESQGMDSARLNQAVDFLANNAGKDGITELVIVRNGYLIWKGSNIDKVHGVWSLTKSCTSTCLGLLIDDGKTTLDTQAKDIIPSMAKDYPDLTLQHFTTMTSGYRAVGDEPQGTYLHGPSQTPFAPGSPLFTPPGSKYAYWDSAMNQFAHILTCIAGEPLADLFKRQIADPIDMNPNNWRWGTFGKIDGIEVNGGSGNSRKHLFISARELARLGHLFLNRGQWHGKQLISRAWVDSVHGVHVPVTLDLGLPESGIEGRGVYGFNWWTNGVKPDGQRQWPDAPLGTYSASGYNNNDMFIIPEWNLVVVRLGLDQQDRVMSDEVYSEFLGNLGQSIDPAD